MYKYISPTVFLLLSAPLLSSCAALPFIADAIMPSASDGLNVSAQIGEEANQQVIIGDQNKTEIEAENVSHVRQDKSNVTSVTAPVQEMIVNNVMATPAWVWLLMILGWMLPSPSAIGSGILSLFRRNKVRTEKQ